MKHKLTKNIIRSEYSQDSKEMVIARILSEFDRKAFVESLLKFMEANERARKLEAEMNKEKASGNIKKAVDICNKLDDTLDEKGFYYNQINKVRDGFFEKYSHLADEDNLNDLEKEVLRENPDLMDNLAKLMFGMANQIDDYFTGIFEKIIKAGLKETAAYEYILNEIKNFGTGLKKHFRWKYRINLDDGDIFLGMVVAVQNWKNNKYLNYIEWIKTVLHTNLRNIRNDIIRGREQEVNVSPKKFDMFLQDEMRALEVAGRKYEGPIFIDQMATLLGVSAQTLRDWDNNNLFKAGRIEKNGKEYRTYSLENLDRLRQIKLGQNRKQKGVNVGEITAAEMAKLLSISKKTLDRYEKSNIFPKPQRNTQGYRIYVKQDVETLKTILKNKSS
ncbi:MAG: MerR family transcriptional regulator [Candidatus Omnitrophica bacterium]|nr:MerR family transcriptional regulator [Candidatus Omnitrophota bacterium]